MSFAATWMDLEIIILSDVTFFRRNLICDTNELIYNIETDSQT